MPKGYRRHGAGWQAEVAVVGHPRSYRQFPLDATDAEIQTWRKEEQARLRLTSRRASKGTFAADASQYLELVKTMPSFAMRARDIDLWTDIFGTRRRSSVTSIEIRLWRDRWHRHGPRRVWRKHPDGRRGGAWVDVEAPLAASTVNHRLRALANLYTVLDGRYAPNPAREVPELEEDEREERSVPYELVEMILAAMPERRHGRMLTDAQAAAALARAKAPHANVSAIAKDYGVSETLIRKLLKSGVKPRRDVQAFSRIRARVIAYTGVSPAELARLTLERVDLGEAWIDTGKRRKGKGVLTGRRPLTPEGLAAMRAFVGAEAWGKFSTSSLRKSIRVAAARVERELAGVPGAEPLIRILRRVRTYDFRHSYVTEVLDKSGDLHATQLLAGHADLRTTIRYSRRAVDPALRAALAKVAAAGGFGGADGKLAEDPGGLRRNSEENRRPSLLQDGQTSKGKIKKLA